MPLAYENQRAPKNDTTLWFRSKTFVKTISSHSLVRPVPVGIRRSVRYVFIYFLRAVEGELQLLLPESRNVRRSMLVGNPAIMQRTKYASLGVRSLRNW
jgi:hypothetical protein